MPAPPPLTSSHEQVATDSVDAPPHHWESRGRQPTAPRRLCLRSRSQHPCVSRGALSSWCDQGWTNGAIQTSHCRAHGWTNVAKMPRHQQCLPSEEEEGRVSHPLGKMRRVPKGAHNKRTRAVRDGCLQQRSVWLVMAAGGVRRWGEHNNQPKEGCTGSRTPKRK